MSGSLATIAATATDGPCVFLTHDTIQLPFEGSTTEVSGTATT
jgi:hypothetical protein